LTLHQKVGSNYTHSASKTDLIKRLMPHLHDQAGSTSWLYVSWTSQLDVCSIV